MSSRLAVVALVGMLALLAAGCTEELPVQPTPDRVEDYFDSIEDELSPLTKYLDVCDYLIPREIFVNQVYYSYDAVRNAIPKSLVTRISDGSLTNGELIEVYLSCETDIAVFAIQTTGGSYQFGDFYGVMNFSASEARAIRDALASFTPKRR